ncbi:MAG TPA: class I SAM-dependent methyltransferase [Thermoplasmata archaeon]|nr:class I SAM-dependent methyltransferase [Thermoplasmata archaeon]
MPDGRAPAILLLVEVEGADGEELPVRGLRTPTDLYLLVQPRTPRWAMAAERRGDVAFRLPDGVWRRAQLRAPVDPDERTELLADARRQVGEVAWARHFGDGTRILAVRLAVPDESGGSAEEAARVAFDALAPTYGARIAREPFQRYLRARALDILRRTFPTPARLLEFGPGSGAQTVPMLLAGHEVTAIDPSERMLGELRRAADAAGVAGRLTTHLGTFGRLGALPVENPDARFDGAYSMFGALNLDPRVADGAEPLARRLVPGAPFVAGFSNRLSFAPLAFLLAAADRPAARDRARLIAGRSIAVGGLPTRPLSPRRLARTLAPWFRRSTGEAISILVPPFPSARLERIFGPAGLARLAALDRRLDSHRWLAEASAEHLALTFRRADAETVGDRAVF